MNSDKQLLEQALEALEEIALAGMSGSGQESQEAMTEWHARKAWKFIGIAARSVSAIKQARLEQPEQEPVAWAGWHTSTDEMMLFKTKAEAVSWRDQYKKGFASIEGLVRPFLPAAPVQEPDHLRDATKMVDEPFGYFKAEPFGWTDCAETDEGAIALYERPAAQRQWVSLTDQEWERLFELYGDDPDILIRETEAKLREKNT